MYSEGDEGVTRTSLVTYTPTIGKDAILRIQIPDWIETEEEQIAYEWGFTKGVQMRAEAPRLRAMERQLREGTAPK
jgi:hypothetical protein